MRLINLCFITLFCTLSALAQSKKMLVKFVFPSENTHKPRIFYENGVGNQEFIYPRNTTETQFTLETDCFQPYLRISLLSTDIFREEMFENDENFYTAEKVSVMEIITNPDSSSNEKYLFKLTGLVKDIGSSAYKSAIKEEVVRLLALRNNPAIFQKDSLQKEANALGRQIDEKTLQLIQANSNDFFYQQLFYSKIATLHYYKSKSYLLSFFTSNFSKSFRTSFYGEKIHDAILDLELDYNSIAPDIRKVSLDKKQIDLKDYRQTYVLINFWATWCRPCVQEIPTLKQLVDAHKDKVTFMMVSYDEDYQTLKKFIKNNNLNAIHIIDNDNSIGDMWKVTAIPKTFLVNKEGRIIYNSNIDEDANLAKLKKVLEKM